MLRTLLKPTLWRVVGFLKSAESLQWKGKEKNEFTVYVYVTVYTVLSVILSSLQDGVIYNVHCTLPRNTSLNVLFDQNDVYRMMCPRWY